MTQRYVRNCIRDLYFEIKHQDKIPTEASVIYGAKCKDATFLRYLLRYYPELSDSIILWSTWFEIPGITEHVERPLSAQLKHFDRWEDALTRARQHIISCFMPKK